MCVLLWRGGGKRGRLEGESVNMNVSSERRGRGIRGRGSRYSLEGT